MDGRHTFMCECPSHVIYETPLSYICEGGFVRNWNHVCTNSIHKCIDAQNERFDENMTETVGRPRDETRRECEKRETRDEGRDEKMT